MKIETIKLDDLRPYEKNARKHGAKDLEAIKASIQAFGFRDPVGVWGPQNVIVEGHGRVLAAKALGMTEVPCIRLDELTDEQRRAYALAHNKTAELSTWDAELLPLELEDLPSYDMTGFGFQMDRVAESMLIEQLDSMKEAGKQIFGKGYLLSERAAAERAAAERAAAHRWPLSDRERESWSVSSGRRTRERPAA